MLAVSLAVRQREDVLVRARAPSLSFASVRGSPLSDAEGHLVLIVENYPAKVEADLAAGRVSCPGCGDVLGRWSFARRRFVRAEAGLLEVRPRRARCRECAKTHVLLPDLLLCRRVDVIAVIGRALSARASPDSATAVVLAFIVVARGDDQVGIGPRELDIVHFRKWNASTWVQEAAPLVVIHRVPFPVAAKILLIV